jgi:hypothetical protein
MVRFVSSFLVVFLSIHFTTSSVPPKIRVFDVPETSVGADASLMCSLGSGTKPVHFTWTKDGNEIQSSHITTLQASSTLVIPVVKLEDRGRYSCSIKSSFGQDIKSADLVVSGEYLWKFSYFCTQILRFTVSAEAPSFLNEPKDVSGIRGEEVRVECKARGEPTPEIKWTKVEGE